MIHKHTELEIKLDASDITEEQFLPWAFAKGPTQFLSVSGPDCFYRQGENIVRVRIPPDGPIQLTVKKRRSQQSIKDRLEVELEVRKNSSLEDVDVFLTSLGFEKDLYLEKQAHIFWFKSGKQDVVVSYYIAKCNNEARAFIECEVSKGSEVTLDTGKRYLKKWTDDINESFSKDLQPLNQSLYEFFKDRSQGNE
jgi:adenylate cyclase class IV